MADYRDVQKTTVIESSPLPMANYDSNKYRFAMCRCNKSGCGYGIPIKISKEWHSFKCTDCNTKGHMYA